MTHRKRTIAIVDDDPRLLESLEDLLESAGYLTRSFSSPASLFIEGLSGIDLLITDIGMSGMDGFELRAVAKDVRPELPVFLITGRHEIADQDRAQGVDAFFRKPFDGSALLAAIGKALRNSNVEGEPNER